MDKRLTLHKFMTLLNGRTKVNIHVSNYPYGEIRYTGEASGYFNWKMHSNFWDAWVIKIGLNQANELCIIVQSQDF